MRRRRRGTFSAIWTRIAGHRSEILRVMRWVAMLVLAILAVREPRGWWSLRTKVEYLGTAVLLVINGVLLLRAWRARHRSTTQQAAATAASAASGNVLWEIPLCWPIFGIRFPSFLRRIEVTRDGNAYSLNERVLLGGVNPAILYKCADPDLGPTKGWNFFQNFGSARVRVRIMGETEPLVFWVSTRDSMQVVNRLNNLITDACKDNGVKRYQPS